MAGEHMFGHSHEKEKEKYLDDVAAQSDNTLLDVREGALYAMWWPEEQHLLICSF